jgi:hypothetical protein
MIVSDKRTGLREYPIGTLPTANRVRAQLDAKQGREGLINSRLAYVSVSRGRYVARSALGVRSRSYRFGICAMSPFSMATRCGCTRSGKRQLRHGPFDPWLRGRTPKAGSVAIKGPASNLNLQERFGHGPAALPHAVTSHSHQGATADRVLVHADTG